MKKINVSLVASFLLATNLYSNETKLETTAEGSVKISECGDGQEIVFSAKEVSKGDVDKTINDFTVAVERFANMGK